MFKPMFILSIIVTLVGGIMMTVSMIFAVIHVVNNIYEDIQLINIDPPITSLTQTSSSFSIQQDQLISFWFNVPNEKVENKDIQITLSLFDRSGGLLTTIKKEFNSTFTRHSDGEQHYYKLGSYHFETAFEGVLQTRFDGSWLVDVPSKLILRQLSSTLIPVQQFYFFLLGIVILIIGVKAVEKYSP